jgi:2-iminoacetate synthase
MIHETGFVPDEDEIEKVIASVHARVHAGTHAAARGKDLLNKEHLSIEDFASIISADENDSVFYEKLARRAREITDMRFGFVKGLYIPLYLSNACHNSCTYCGFSMNNKVPRTTLTVEEVRSELLTIRKKGFSNILLVSGELKDFSNIDYLADCVKAARDAGFHSIAVELGALDEESSHLLAKSGAQSFVLYQETYHEGTYGRVHTGGLKRDYRYRLGGAERAIKAGFRQVALGFLAGLHDARFEALALYKHLSYLKERYWEVEYAVSFPRFNRASGVADFNRISDKSYAKILMAFRLAFPEVSINLSTRETPEFRDGMSAICVTHLSIESKTQPGGYTESGTDRLEQFSIHDSRSLGEMTLALKSIGYDVHFKDWEMELNRL